MGCIRVLSQEVADRIAAGEVVERPASVVKELIENALDAGATGLSLELEEGGLRLIRLTDDGRGMSQEDLALCVLPHATSKIADVDDLFRISSFGFRGEALPSIAAVSEVLIRSRPREAPSGARIEVRGGERTGPRPDGMPPGTIVEVRGLFFNVPARRKFLRSPRAEYAQVLDMITRLLLPHPAVALRVHHDGRKALDLRPVRDERERVAELFGEEAAQSLLALEGEREGLRIRGYASRTERTRRTGDQQFLFLNGRFIRDRGLAFAVRDAYSGFILPRQHPSVFLFMDLAPDRFDVNVHPTKTEVRFRDRDLAVGLVRHLLRRRLEAGDAAPRLRMAEPSRVREGAPPAMQATPGAVLEELARELFGGEGGAAAEPGSPIPEPFHGRPPVRVRRSCGDPVAPRAGRSPGPSVQIHRSYLVTEDQDGLVILDQHALHERRLFEALMDQFRRSAVESQRLLLPETLALGPARLEFLLQAAPDLAAMGIEVAAFGPGTAAVHAVPALLARASPAGLVETVLVALEEGREPGRGGFHERVAADLACRSAVRFGDALDPTAQAELLAWWRAHPALRNCPHGRPVALRLGLAELERLFERKT
jgi:DNA mismatch repair protein MutL